MRTLTKLAICLALLTFTVNKAHAYETFAPLISENCVAFIHVDFSKIEIDNVKAVLQETGESLLRELGFDQQSFAATARELAIELEKLDIIVRPYWETITKEIGVREIAFIVDLELLATSAPPAVVIPWKNKTDRQFEALHTLLQVPEGNIVKIDGFLILTVSARWTEAITDWAKSVTPASADSAIHEALKSVADADIKIVATIPEQLRAMAQSGIGMPPGMPNEVRGLIMFAAQRVQWASASVSFSDTVFSGIGGGEPRENSDVFLTIKTNRPTDATMLRNMLEQLIDFGINSAQFAMNSNMREFDVEVTPAMTFATSPLAFSFARGFLRTLLPDVEGDKLIFRAKGGLPVAATSVGLFIPLRFFVQQRTTQIALGGTQQVSGTVMFSDGTPVPIGMLFLESPTFVAQADIQPDGTYTFVGNIPNGTYRVFIRRAESLIDPRYQNPNTSGLMIEIRGRTVFNVVVGRPGE